MKLNLPQIKKKQRLIIHKSVSDLYDTYAAALMAYILKINPEVHQAERILHNVFMQEHTKSLLENNTANIFVSLLNKVRNEAVESLVNTSPLRINSNGARCVAMNSPHMQALFQTLPLIEKTILALNFYRGLNVSEIADFLMLPHQLVQTKLHSALQNLQQHHNSKVKV